MSQGPRIDVARILTTVRKREVDREHLSQGALDVAARQRTSALPWRGQFTPEFVEVMLRTHAEAGAVVVDPFVGSGTVLHEAARLGLPSAGAEVNPAALELSKVFELQASAPNVRREALGAAEAEIAALVMDFTADDVALPGRMVEVIRRESGSLSAQLLTATLMLGMGNSHNLRAASLMKAFHAVRKVVSSMPETPVSCSVFGADARSLPLPDSFAGLIVTSPPYINVFNYHQNYRPAVELLGWDVLPAARSEIGSNRKHRQNRFLTVAQYCIDMGLALIEMARVCAPGAAIVITLGRESRVLDVPFPNGEIIAVLGELLPQLRFERWQERSFLNRFGETIFEDILTFRRTAEHASRPDYMHGAANDLGSVLLGEAAASVNDRPEIEDLIVAAASFAPKTQPSPELALGKLPLAS